MTAYLQRAHLLFQRGRYAEAEKELALGLAENPNNPRAHALWAWCLTQREKYDEATEHAEQALGLAPDDPFMHHTLAQVWMLRNYHDKAEAAVREALALDPHNPEHFTLLARIHLRRRRWKAALEAADQALALDAESTAAQNLRATALRKMGKGASAESQLQQALRVRPNDPWTHANLGWTALEKGDRKNAMTHFREALRLDPELDWAREGVVETLKSRNPWYRGVLKFFLWMNRLGRSAQWAVILGGYVAYRIAWELAESYAALRPWLIPLIVAYLLFALSTILAVPLANLALRLHPFGRLALSRDERVTSAWLGGFLLAALIAAALWSATGGDFAAIAGLCLALMLIPIGVTGQCARPRPRKQMVIYTVTVGAVGALNLAIIGLFFTDLTIEPALELLGEDLLLVVAEISRLARWLFIGGAILSIWAANIFATVTWKR